MDNRSPDPAGYAGYDGQLLDHDAIFLFKFFILSLYIVCFF